MKIKQWIETIVEIIAKKKLKYLQSTHKNMYPYWVSNHDTVTRAALLPSEPVRPFSIWLYDVILLEYADKVVASLRSSRRSIDEGCSQQQSTTTPFPYLIFLFVSLT